jgi:S-adenosylmethionine:tRNA ribosyltransferase-isomerase
MSAATLAERETPRGRALPGLLEFELPPELSAHKPPEARGLERDGVRLMVSDVGENRIRHAAFADLAAFLDPGDLLVVNASATINAALTARWKSGPHEGEPVRLHLSTPLPGGRPDEWVVELREPTPDGTEPLLTASPGEGLRLEGGAGATLVEPYSRGDGIAGLSDRRDHPPDPPRVRLWVARLSVPGGVLAFAARYGSPIRYRYVREPWPLSAYQTVFATEPGSAEMPSAGRPFSSRVLHRLRRKGIRWAPLVLHTGVASLESGEPPYPEPYRVPRATAAAVRAARDAGRRVIAVGTTVVRALETVATADGRVRAGGGWTELIVTPERGIRAVDGILTGLHEPRSSHLAMLEAFGGLDHLESTYRAALEERYLWHEFGDVHLMLR